jgi:hypothetical protein
MSDYSAFSSYEGVAYESAPVINNSVQASLTPIYSTTTALNNSANVSYQQPTLSAPIQTSQSVIINSFDSAPVHHTTYSVSASLKAQAVQFLQQSAGRYMENQESILKAMKLTMDSIKELDESLQNNMEILQKNFKKAQDRLQKELKADQNEVKERIQSKKQNLQQRMEKLTELNQEAQKKYFESQQNAIDLYKRTAKKNSQ